MRRDHVELALERRQLAARDDAAPDLARAETRARRRARPCSSTRPREMIAMRRHRSLTSSTMWVERMTTTFSPISDSRLRKRSRSPGSSPAVGSSTMMSRGLADAAPARCRSAASCRPRRCRAAACARPTGWSCAAGRATTSSRAARLDDPLEHGEVVEHRLGGDPSGRPRTPAAGSRAGGARSSFSRSDVDAVERDRPRVRLLERGDRAHQRATCRRRWARAGRTSRSGMVRRHAVERAHAVRVGLGQIGDSQLHRHRGTPPDE